MADEYLQILPSLAWDQFPDEIVAIDLERGVYFNLTAGGAETFQAFATPTTLEAVVARLVPRFDAPADAVSAAVVRLVGELVAEGLLVPAAAPAAAPPATPAEAVAQRKALAGFSLQRHDDIHELLVIDPVHQVTDGGWPAKKA